jgi:hypothetical protein
LSEFASQNLRGRFSEFGTECVSGFTPGLGLLPDVDVPGFGVKPGGVEFSEYGTECVSGFTTGLGVLPADDDVSGFGAKPGGVESSELGTECASGFTPGLGVLPVDENVSGFAEKPGGVGKRSSDGPGRLAWVEGGGRVREPATGIDPTRRLFMYLCLATAIAVRTCCVKSVEYAALGGRAPVGRAPSGDALGGRGGRAPSSDALGGRVYSHPLDGRVYSHPLDGRVYSHLDGCALCGHELDGHSLGGNAPALCGHTLGGRSLGGNALGGALGGHRPGGGVRAPPVMGTFIDASSSIGSHRFCDAAVTSFATFASRHASGISRTTAAGAASAKLMMKSIRRVRVSILCCRICMGYVTLIRWCCPLSDQVGAELLAKRKEFQNKRKGLKIKEGYQLKERKGHTHYPVPENVKGSKR